MKTPIVLAKLVEAGIELDNIIIANMHEAEGKILLIEKQCAHNKDDLETMEDSEFDRMLANAIHLPDTEEGSSAGIIGSSSGLIGKSTANAELLGGMVHPQSIKDKNLKQKDSSVEKEDDCDISIPVLPSNSGALVIRPCTTTDESTNIEDESIDERNKELENDETQEGKCEAR